METLERRAILLAVVLALILVFYGPGDFTSDRGRGWEVAVYILGLACLAVGAALLVAAIAPDAFLSIPGDRRERFLFFAFALAAAAILAKALLRAYTTYYVHTHGL